MQECKNEARASENFNMEAELFTNVLALWEAHRTFIALLDTFSEDV